MTPTGTLRVVLDRKRERTRVREAFFQGALKITRPVYLDDSGQATLYLMNPGGGYVSGDTYWMDIELEANAELLLTTQSSTKIYKAVGQPAVQETEIRLGAGSLLEYVPDATIAYPNARYQQQTVVRMEPGATLLYAELMTPGWSPEGALFPYDCIQSKMKVYLAERLVLFDHLRLQPDELFAGTGFMEGHTHFGTMTVICDKVTPEFIDQLYEFLEERKGQALFGVSELSVPGFTLRVLAGLTQEITALFENCQLLIRERLFGKQAVYLRK